MQHVVGVHNVANKSSRALTGFRTHLRYATHQQKQLPAVRGQTRPAPLEQQHGKQKESSNQTSGPPKVVTLLLTLLGGGIAFYTGELFIAANKPCPNPAIKDISQQEDVSGRYEYTADSFDSEVGTSEWLMRINATRDRLAKMCKGHVLEVSCGTGRNLGYYDVKRHGRVESLTMVDLSPQMIALCKKKWEVLFGNKKAEQLKSGLVVRFLASSALEDMPLAPEGKKYDTIIQTMGLCSTPTPVELLTNMARHLDMGNPESRILLLEHGRSYRSWLNNILDSSAEKHAEIHGCWYNRDIGALVEEAASKSGLEIVKERRHHLGTTWLFELKPKTKTAQDQKTSELQPEAKGISAWFSFYR